MFTPSKCPCCEELRKQRDYLQGLLDRTLAIIAPKPDEVKPEELPEDNENLIKYGEGS